MMMDELEQRVSKTAAMCRTLTRVFVPWFLQERFTIDMLIDMEFIV